MPLRQACEKVSRVLLQKSETEGAAELVAAGKLQLMTPSRQVLAVALIFSVGGRLGEAFRVQHTCLSKRWIGMGSLSHRRATCGYPVSRPVPRAGRIAIALDQGQPRDARGSSRQGRSLVKAQEMETAEETGSEGMRHTEYGSSMLCH